MIQLSTDEAMSAVIELKARAEVMRRRVKGESVYEIAGKMGLSSAEVQRYIKADYEDLERLDRAATRQARHLENQRLDALQLKLDSLINPPEDKPVDYKTQTDAIKLSLGVATRRARLNGLDQDVRPNTIPREVVELLEAHGVTLPQVLSFIIPAIQALEAKAVTDVLQLGDGA